MTIKQISCSSPHRQKGVASLLIALVILVTITFVILYTSRSVLMEQKVTTNDYRGRMAFEAAEAGIEATMAAQNLGWLRTADANGDGIPDGKDVPTLIASNIVFDGNGIDVAADGTAANNSNSFRLANGSRVVVSLTEGSRDGLIITNVSSTGTSDDGTAERTITQSIVLLPPIPNKVDTPLLTHGGVMIGGSATVTNPEGHSTIWSGENVNLGSNNSTATETADPADAHYPDCLGGSVQCGTVESSNREVVGVDIIEADTSLKNLTDEQFFQNFFGVKPRVYRDSRASVITTDLSSQKGATSEIIWVDGDVNISSNNVFGSMTEPVIVIVDGDFNATGTNDFYGILYVTGNIVGSGSVDVIGAAIVNGVDNAGGGSLDVTFNSKVLKALFADSMPAGSGGSWRDF